MDSFQFTCLRRILRIRWPQKICNEEIEKITRVSKIIKELRRRGWNWIGHVLRKAQNNDCLVAMGWQPEMERAVGCPKTTWRWPVGKERRREGWRSWNEIWGLVKDRAEWKKKPAALCASWPGENSKIIIWIYIQQTKMKASVLSAVGFVPPFCLEFHVTYECRRWNCGHVDLVELVVNINLNYKLYKHKL